MVINKEINLTFEGFRVEIEMNNEMDTTFLRMSEFVIDKKESKPFNTVYKEGKKLEILTCAEELKEIVKALNQILEGETEKA